MKTFFTLITCMLTAVMSFGQTSQIKDSLTYFIGNWSGSGTLSEKGQQTNFNQSETIQWSTGNTTVSVSGIGTNPETGEVSFEATGIIYYSNDGSGFHMHSFTSEGQQVISEVSFPKPGSLYWQFEVEGGIIQYEITVVGDDWEERGYFKPADSTNRYPFIEMKLTREP